MQKEQEVYCNTDESDGNDVAAHSSLILSLTGTDDLTRTTKQGNDDNIPEEVNEAYDTDANNVDHEVGLDSESHAVSEITHSKMILELTSVNADLERVDEADMQVDIEEATTRSNNDESVQPMPSLLRNTNRSTLVVTQPGAYRVAGSASQRR